MRKPAGEIIYSYIHTYTITSRQRPLAVICHSSIMSLLYHRSVESLPWLAASHLARKTQTFEMKQIWRKKNLKVSLFVFFPKDPSSSLGPVKTVEEVAAARGIKYNESCQNGVAEKKKLYRR